jgi:hypothetical protein
MKADMQEAKMYVIVKFNVGLIIPKSCISYKLIIKIVRRTMK